MFESEAYEYDTIRSGNGELARIKLKKVLAARSAAGWRVDSVAKFTPDVRHYVFKRPRTMHR